MQIDTTRLDVLALFDDGTLGRPEMTIAVDVASRAILAAVLCPGGTQVVDAALLLAEMAVPHPSKPTWPDALRFTHTQLIPRARLLTLDERVYGGLRDPRRQRAARPALRAHRQGHRGADLRLDQHPVLSAPARLHRDPTSPAEGATPNVRRVSPSRNCRTSSTNGSCTTTTARTKGCVIRCCPRPH